MVWAFCLFGLCFFCLVLFFEEFICLGFFSFGIFCVFFKKIFGLVFGVFLFVCLVVFFPLLGYSWKEYSQNLLLFIFQKCPSWRLSFLQGRGNVSNKVPLFSNFLPINLLK